MYVNSQGESSRSFHLFWPAKPLPHGFTFRAPHLFCFTEIGLFVFNVETGVWQGSLGGRRLQPLAADGHLCMLRPARAPGAQAGITSSSASSSSSQPSALASLVVIPPASFLRQRPLANNSELRTLDLSTVILLDSNARNRVRYQELLVFQLAVDLNLSEGS